MSIDCNNIESSLVFQLKGGLYPLTALQLLSSNLRALSAQLDAKIMQAPKFFYNAPVVIDLQKITSMSTPIDFKFLKDTLQSKHLVPVGIKGGTKEQQALATLAGIAVLAEGSKEREILNSSETVKVKTSETLETDTSEAPATQTKVITEPVRSGQQIYARNGDLIVLAPVSHGSELLADGHIHVYGPLRGRALAGVNGYQNAHIFCQSLEAELVSVAGQYKISEDIEQTLWRNSANIYLESGRLHIRPL